MTRDYIDKIRVTRTICGKKHRQHKAECVVLEKPPIERFEQRDDGLWYERREPTQMRLGVG